MTETQTKEEIQRRLAGFSRGDLAANARSLLDALGYRSEKRIDLAPNTADEFRANFDADGRMNPAAALLDRWESVDVLFQLTDEEVRAAAGGQLAFAALGEPVDGAIIESYLFIAIGLDGPHYTRSQLAGATREVNKLFPMPVLILFRHGDTLTLAVIDRRLNKKDASRDVLEKVTLIKDIAFARPHRAHLEILFDLSFGELRARHGFTNFVELHRAWGKALDTAELNKKFFREVANWYYWAVDKVTFPPGAGADPATRNAVSVIRLITRLIFVWFIREKGLVPPGLFEKRALDRLLRWNDPRGSTYYKAILQNLFFATLNTDMDRDKPGSRRFRGKNDSGRDAHYGIANVYRYQECFTDPDAALALFADVPFLNGGLFECLDRAAEGVRIDGFSDRADNPLVVPDFLFFGEERNVDLNETLGTRNKQYRVQGLLRIFERYKFTIEENTPIEEEIALDPELLGKVFENLLAEYNPETGATARKQTGSFYTPRPIVEYMVDESLLAYLQTRLAPEDGEDDAALRDRLAGLLAYTDRPHDFDEAETQRLIAAIDEVKVLDPACGSGAFPMGVLHKLVYLLGKLDPGNARWRARQIEKATEIPDATAAEAAIASIEQVFSYNYNNYGRKLYLIENCIYGVDIQPIAVQIAKLRFFISLVVDQKVDDARPNRGIRALPNLETKFVAANTLIGIERPQQLAFRNPAIEQKEAELAEVRRRHFAARSQATKEKYREQDRRLRQEIAELLRADGWGSATAAQLAAWDPYDQNAHADFFDPEWVFGVANGFDVVIGNPPYVSFGLRGTPTLAEEEKAALRVLYPNSAEYKISLYAVFMDKAIQLTCPNRGIQSFIVPDSFLLGRYFSKIRSFILASSDIRHVVLLPFSVFGATVGFSVVYLLQRTPQPERNHKVSAKLATDVSAFVRKDLSEFSYPQSYFYTRPYCRFNLFFSANVMRLVTKIEEGASELGEHVAFRSGLISKYGQKLIISESKLSPEWLPGIISGGEIAPYLVQPTGYFLYYKKSLIKSGYDNVDYFGHKLFLRQTGDKPICAFDDRGLLALNNIHVGTATKPGVSLKCVMALLNSRLIGFYYRSVSLEAGRAMAQTDIESVERLPLRLDIGFQHRIEAMADHILAAKRVDSAADVSALEAEIDQLVYQLYELTPEEISIIEESSR